MKLFYHAFDVVCCENKHDIVRCFVSWNNNTFFMKSDSNNEFIRLFDIRRCSSYTLVIFNEANMSPVFECLYLNLAFGEKHGKNLFV